MEEIKKFLADGAESEFFEGTRLNDIESKSDPESEPYRSMYKARETWQRLKGTIDRYQESTADTGFWNVLGAALDLKLGINYNETDEKSTGEERLVNCLARLESSPTQIEVCGVLLAAHNQLGILYSDRGEAENGLKQLQKAELLYANFVEKIGGAPWTVDDLFRSESYDENADMPEIVRRRMDSFEDAHTHTLYYLAQVHTKLSNGDIAANYCRQTLRRQLDTHRYQPVDWAMNAATLSQYYIGQNDFVLSRHCLASAECILKETSEHVDSEVEDGESKVHKAWADLYRCWAKYGLALLEFSKERLYRDPDEPESDRNRFPTSPDMSDDLSKSERERFFDLELTAIEGRIDDKPASVFEEARMIFKPVQSWLEAAKVFYKLDGHTSDHIEIVLDHSHLYKNLAFFEPDMERQCKMHKRRADLLEKILSVLNQQFYLLVCRQLMFELGEIYSTMLDNKYSILEESNSAMTEHARLKINALAQKSIDNFCAYTNSLRNSTGDFPCRFQDDDERPALIAHFYIGRLYSKFVDVNVPMTLKYLKGSVDNYKFLVDYCRRNPEAMTKVKQEFEVCEEMVQLLPAKMEKIRASAE